MHYGAHHDQQLTRHDPIQGRATGAALVIHGGYWRTQYDASLGSALAADLATRGLAAYNLEYRRGPGSAATMLADARAALQLIPEPGPITVIGHSAGAQLGCVLAAHEPRISQVISQAGLLDLALADELELSQNAVREMLGDTQLAAVDPVQLWPMAARVIIFHGREDKDVPVQMAQRAAQRAVHCGQEHRLRLFDGDHYSWIDPTSAHWAACVEQLTELHFGGTR